MNDDRVTLVKGNHFAALGLPDSEEMWIKSRLAILISMCIEERNLTRTTAARLLGLKKKALTSLLRGHFRNVSTYELMVYALRLGHDVEIVVRPSGDHKKKKKTKQIRINLADAFEYSITTRRMDVSRIV